MKKFVPVFGVMFCLALRSAEPPGGAANAANQAQFFCVAGDGVNSPGRFAFREGMTLTNAIRMAGGFVRFAAKSRVEVTHKGQTQPLVIDVSRVESGQTNDFQIQPDDYIHVRGPVIIHQNWHDNLWKSRAPGTNQSTMPR